MMMTVIIIVSTGRFVPISENMQVKYMTWGNTKLKLIINYTANLHMT